ncbi:MAG: hypothetical protein WAK17_03550 [Candidatus Nitrosopolaris sp.]
MTPEDLLKPFLGSLTFGIDITVGVVIAIFVLQLSKDLPLRENADSLQTIQLSNGHSVKISVLHALTNNEERMHHFKN